LGIFKSSLRKELESALVNLARTYPFARTRREPQSEIDASVADVRRLAGLVRMRSGDAALRKAWQAARDDIVVSMIRTEHNMRAHWGPLEKLVTSLLFPPPQSVHAAGDADRDPAIEGRQ
jgi:hypothetical protein